MTAIANGSDEHEHLRKRRELIDPIQWRVADTNDENASDFIRNEDWGATDYSEDYLEDCNYEEGKGSKGSKNSKSSKGSRPCRPLPTNDHPETTPHPQGNTPDPPPTEEASCGAPGLGMCPVNYHCECTCTYDPPATDDPSTTTTTEYTPVETCESVRHPQIVDESCCKHMARTWNHPDLCCKCSATKFIFVDDKDKCQACDEVPPATSETTSTTTTLPPDTKSTTTTILLPDTTTTMTLPPDTTSSTITTTLPPDTTTTTTLPQVDDKCRDPSDDTIVVGYLGGLCDLTPDPYIEAGLPFPCCVASGINSCITCDDCDALQPVSQSCCSEGEQGCPDDKPFCCRTETGFTCETSEDTCYEPSPPTDS